MTSSENVSVLKQNKLFWLTEQIPIQEMSFTDVSNKFKIKNSTPKTTEGKSVVVIFFRIFSIYPFTNQKVCGIIIFVV